MIRANLLSLPRRLAISLSMILTVALTVGVLTGFLAMAKGFEKALTGVGSPSVAIILGGGTNQEMASEIPVDSIRSIEAMSGDIGVTRNEVGNITASRELVVPVDFTKGQDGTSRTLALRGMDVAGLAIRDSVTISKGQMFHAGSREIVVGDRLAKDYPAFAVGKQIRLGPVNWTVVGHFSAHGSAFESEIWGGLDTVRSAFDRQGEVQSLRVKLTNPSTLETLNTKLGTVTITPLRAVSEVALYAAQSGRTSALIRTFGWPLALLMAIGATAGALNTMMSSVSDRTVEIATVRALGFSRLSAFLATWLEAIILAAVGAAIGVVASWVGFNGWQASTMGANNTSMAFSLSVTSGVMMTAGLFGILIGVIGGALPALTATRLPLTEALRASG